MKRCMTYCTCECGRLIQLREVAETLELKQARAVAYGGACPECQRVATMTFIHPSPIHQPTIEVVKG